MFMPKFPYCGDEPDYFLPNSYTPNIDHLSWQQCVDYATSSGHLYDGVSRDPMPWSQDTPVDTTFNNTTGVSSLTVVVIAAILFLSFTVYFAVHTSTSKSNETGE